jgi:DNA-binding NtrC family response regulator
VVEEASQAHAARGPVLVVDDDHVTRAVVARVLEEAGYDVRQAARADEARSRLAQTPFAAVVCDVVMPGETGFGLVAHIRREHPDTRIVVMSGAADASLTKSTIELGVAGFVPKPIRPERVLAELDNAFA